MEQQKRASNLFHDNLRTVKDWPKEGIEFLDILKTVAFQPEVNAAVIDCFMDYYKDADIDAVAGVEARGFIFGAQLSYALHLPLVPIRKSGKCPPPISTVEYELEYGTDTLELESVLIEEGMKVLLIDDLIATGGTANAAIKLLKNAGAEVPYAAFIVELRELDWKSQIQEGTEVFCVTDFPK